MGRPKIALEGDGGGAMYVSRKDKYFESVYKLGGLRFNIFKARDEYTPIAALKRIFPEGVACNGAFALFGTGGIYGTKQTVTKLYKCDEYRFKLLEHSTDPNYVKPVVTFLIIHYTYAGIRCGNVRVATLSDVNYLVRLQRTSQAVMLELGV